MVNHHLTIIGEISAPERSRLQKESGGKTRSRRSGRRFNITIKIVEKKEKKKNRRRKYGIIIRM